MLSLSAIYKIKALLRPLTPVHVWSGVKGYVGLDIFIDVGANTCCVADLESIKLDVNEVIGLIEGRSNLKNVVDDAYKRGRLKCKRVVKLYAKSLLQGVREVMLINNLLIPGSTLKGYIRTALLTYLLNRDYTTKGLNYVAKVIDDEIDLGLEPKFTSTGLEAYYFRSPKSQGGFFDALQQFMVSDPLATSHIGVAFRDAYVYEVSGSHVARLVLETLDEGILEYEIRIRQINKDLLLNYLSKMTMPSNDVSKLKEVITLISSLELHKRDNLVKVLQTFSKLLIEDELNKIRKCKDILASNGIDLRKYEMLLNNLLNAVRISTQCVPIRIGLLTGHMSKTVDAFINKVYAKKYFEVCSAMSQKIGKTWDSLTLKLVRHGEDFYGLGWVELCLS